MPERESWVPIADFGAVHEAEIATQVLEEAGVASRIAGDEAGSGPGWTGGASQRVRVLVPESRAEQARWILKEEEPPEP